MSDAGDTGAGSLPGYERRLLLQAALGTGLGLLAAERFDNVRLGGTRPMLGNHGLHGLYDAFGSDLQLVQFFG